VDGLRHGREPVAHRALVAKWLAEGWCRECIFNLKLPMKKRWEESERCRGIIDEALGGGGYYLRFKQLYHDREEVTGYLARRERADRLARQRMSARIVISEFMDAAGGRAARRALRGRLPPELVDDPPALAGGAARRGGVDRAQPDAVRGSSCAAARLRVVGRLGVGLDNIDVAACEARGIEVIPATGPTRSRSPSTS
jgi:hypothetical protein